MLPSSILGLPVAILGGQTAFNTRNSSGSKMFVGFETDSSAIQKEPSKSKEKTSTNTAFCRQTV